MKRHNGGTLRYTVDGVKKCHRIPPGATDVSFAMEPDNTFKVGDRVRQKAHPDVKGTITKIYMGRSTFSQAETYAELDNGGPSNSYLTICFELDTPPEPPFGSVVVDKTGYAFQRGYDGWHQAGDTGVLSWKQLQDLDGLLPFKEVYRP